MQTTDTAILLNIYNASAGSGKTTRLIKEILNLLLKPDDISFDEKDEKYVRHICGLTFTNAVANELKNRLVQILYDIAFNQNKLSEHKQKYFDNNVQDNTIQERAKTLLSHILHNYSDVSLFTIDAFSNRIMKSFAYELNYSTNYEIAPDTTNYYSQTIDEFLDSIDSTNNEYFRDVLDFLKKDEDKYTHINVFINEIKKMLEALVEKELDISAILEIEDNLNNIDKSKLKQIYWKHWNIKKSTIEEFNNNVRKDIKEIGKNYYTINNNGILEIINGSTLNKNKIGPLNKLYKNPYNEFNKVNWESDFFNKSNEKQTHEANIKKIYENNKSLYEELVKYEETIRTFKMLIDNISITHLAIELLKQLNELKQKDNVVFFSDFTREINKIIQEETQEETNVDFVYFIYERAGVRYNNFLIDEFQDTSTMQFNNLLPLIHNAMAQGNPNYIVGDPKQSIYIWRNANVGQFVTLCEKKDIPLKKLKEWGNFKNQIKIEQLDINYRSAKNIVEFNNLIFDELKYKDYKLVEDVYKYAAQKTNNTKNGYIEVIEIKGKTNKKDEEIIYNIFSEKVVEIINECIQKGFQQKDICILLRRNKDIYELIKRTHHRILSDNNKLSYISPEGLLIYLAPDIVFIISFLGLLANSDNKIFSAVCWEYINSKNDNKKSVYQSDNFYSHYLNYENFRKQFSTDVIANKDIYQIVLDIIQYFKISFDPYVQKLLDVVNQFTYRYATTSNTIESFLTFWEENKKSFTITVDKETNAVKVMTIHKSKGLEFPVIITLLNFNHRDNDYWVKVPDSYQLKLTPPKDESSEDIIEDFQNLYFYLSTSEIEKIDNSKYQQLIEEEHLENINLIYVALTRAIDRLYIVGREKNDYYPSIIQDKIKNNPDKFTQKINEDQPDVITYQFGDENSGPTKQASKEYEKIEIDNLSLSYNRNILLANNANPYSDEQVLGIKIHKVLEYINDSQNIDSALCKAIAKGIISDTEKEEISTKITQLIQHPILNQYFQNNNIQKILNEIEIYHYNQDEENNENIYRPDKIIFTKNNNIAVLEFKTGKELKKYQTQIKRYISILKEIYPDKNIKGFIIYLQENQIEVKEIANEVEIGK